MGRIKDEWSGRDRIKVKIENKRGERMESRKIFSKLNMKDYNNELEKILDNKLFSLDVKNILLSMLYKIENAYKDYSTVKIEVLPKKEFIQYLLKIIKDKCFEIEFIKTDDEENETIEKIIVDKEKGRIKCYPNEKSLLSAIWYMGEKTVECNPMYEYTKQAMEEAIEVGSNMNQSEAIRDFNGWSWDIAIKEIENIPYNILYQTLLMLYGENINYININDMPDIPEEEKEQIQNHILKKKSEEEIIDYIYKVAMQEFLKQHKEKLEEMLTIKESKKQEYELLQDKKKLTQTISDKKKKCNQEIEKIDKIINNSTLLRKEYIKRNEKLPNKEKIFSISHLAERLEKERNVILDEIKSYNRLLDPKEYVNEKEKVKKEVEFLENIELEKDNDIEKTIIKLCKLTISKIKTRIEKLQDRDEIIDWIYKIRYYAFIPINEEKYLKDIEELSKGFENIIKCMINKTQQQKIWETFSEDKILSYQILKEIFYSKIIDLENISIATKYENKTLYVQYFDANILEKKIKIQSENVKIKKKFKLFI